MLWDIIRDFFVQFVFGGVDSNQVIYNGFIGLGVSSIENGYTYDELYSGTFGLPIGSAFGDYNATGEICYMFIGDWLSTTATIITLCLLVAFLFLVVRWLFKLVSGLITLRG